MSLNPRWSLPVKVIPDDGESGLSFLMRAFCANGLSLDKAQEWLQIKSWFSLGRQEISLLAWHLEVDPDWLRWRLLTIKSRSSLNYYAMFGCKFVAASLRRLSTVALCPVCLRENGFCRPSWVFKCFVVCSVHGKYLVEDCEKCGRPISWNRPSIDVCSCGRYLTGSKVQNVASDQLRCWGCWIEWRLGTYEGLDGDRFFELIPSVLNSMSLDGAMRLVISFGILDVATQTVGVSTWRNLNNIGVSEVTERGLSRLHQIKNSLDSLADFGDVVHLPILERMRSDGVEPSDIQNASQLVTALRKNSFGTWDRRVKLTHDQRSLFW